MRSCVSVDSITMSQQSLPLHQYRITTFWNLNMLNRRQDASVLVWAVNDLLAVIKAPLPQFEGAHRVNNVSEQHLNSLNSISTPDSSLLLTWVESLCCILTKDCISLGVQQSLMKTGCSALANCVSTIIDLQRAWQMICHSFASKACQRHSNTYTDNSTWSALMNCWPSSH